MEFTPIKISQIYKANQCTDINDVLYAIELTKNLSKVNGYTPALRRRLNSLEKRKESFLEVVYDAYNKKISEGDLLSVQNLKEPVMVYYKTDGILYFKPYDKEERVTHYFRQDYIKI